MPQLPQATSKEDWFTSLTNRIDSAEKAFRIAAAYAKILNQEWLVGLYLDRTMQLIDRRQVFLSPTCQPCPLDALEALLDAAYYYPLHSLVTVRYHTHPWRGPRTPGMRRFRAFRLHAESQGFVLHDLVISDSTGEVYSVRGNWVGVPAVQPARISSGMAALSSN